MRGPILKGKVLSQLAPIVRLVYPKPNNYWDPIGKVFKVSNSVEVEVLHEYIGNYSIDLGFLKGEPDNPFKLNKPLLGSVSFYGQDKLLFEKEFFQPSPFWGMSFSGVKLIWYRVPDMIPNSINVTVRVDFKSGLAELKEQYGDVFLVVSKSSDM